MLIMKVNFRIMFVFALVFMLSFSAPVSADVKSLDDLKTAKVGIEVNSVAEAVAHDVLKDFKTEFVKYDSVGELVGGLISGEVEAIILDENPARFFALDTAQLKILEQPLLSENYGIAFKKDDPLRAQVNKALQEIKNDGTLEKIITKYVGGEPTPDEIDFNRNPDNKKLWVGCAASFPPYDMRSDDGFFGIDIELCAAIAKKLGMELVIADYRFDLLFEALAAGKVDMLCSGLTINEERSKNFDFSEPYESDQIVVMIFEKNEAQK